VDFEILGPLEVVEGGRSVALGGPLQRAVLAILLTRANEVVSTDRLIDALWAGRPPIAAANTIQQYVSQLRKRLGSDRIVTRAPGYLIRVETGELDLERFEKLVDRGDNDALHEALSLWRGPALADIALGAFPEAEIARLEELRLAALERRIDSDLELGRHAELVGELEKLIADYPLRERLRAQLMLALYRSGRQAEALSVYQHARKALVDELGIEPGLDLQELERAILSHDPSLAATSDRTTPTRSILVAAVGAGALDSLIPIAEPLGRRPPRELVLVEVVAPGELNTATARLGARRDDLLNRGLAVRAAAFTSRDPGADLTKLAAQQDVDLLLVDGSAEELGEPSLAPTLATMLERAPCDVAVLLKSGTPKAGGAVLVPFGGADHEWAAVEVAAWFASATDSPLMLAGSEGGKKGDASRLLASASLLLQRALGIAAEPLLVPPGPDGVIVASEGASIVVLGLSVRWRQEGLGQTRLEVARRARLPVLLVRKGPRPGGLAPSETLTRFTWSLRSATRAS
jgi:DNA-binding SARP family transcriptional activator